MVKVSIRRLVSISHNFHSDVEIYKFSSHEVHMSFRDTLKHVIFIEAVGFIVVIFAIWSVELFDLHFYLFHTDHQPANFEEGIFESLFVLALALAVMLVTSRLLKRIKQLEEFLPICSFCKKIRKPNSNASKQESWERIEFYINKKTGTQFSHGLCPECYEKHYGKNN